MKEPLYDSELDWSELIDPKSINVYGLDYSVKCSKYPMSTDIMKCVNLSNWNYWDSYEDFIKDFYLYQKFYNKEKSDKKDECCFCKGKTSVETYKDTNKKYCSKHRHQLERYGECFEITPKYELMEDYVLMTVYGDKQSSCETKISYESLPYVFYWNCTKNGDSYISTNNGIQLHRRLMLNQLTEEKNIVDHINRDIYDNRLCNLRAVSCQENIINSSLSKNNTSNIIGVNYRKDRKKMIWRAYITNNRKTIFLGNYKNKEEAIKARLIAEKSIYKNYAPQKHLFKEYGIEECESEANEEFKYNLKEALKEYNRAYVLSSKGAGTGEGNFLKGIIVEFDLTMTPKMSVELERYHFIDFISSCSTMHKITYFYVYKAYIKWTDQRCIDVVKELVEEYNSLTQEEKDSPYGKELYLRILYSNPCGMKLTAGMVTNYLQLKTIYQQRYNHRLPEWRAFCRWIETLPHSEWITGKE